MHTVAWFRREAHALCVRDVLQLLDGQSMPGAATGSSDLPATHPFALACSPLVSALQLCVSSAPVGSGHQLVQSLCMELVLLYGSHIMPGLEGVHTQVRAALEAH
jgi:hypothetical protein